MRMIVWVLALGAAACLWGQNIREAKVAEIDARVAALQQEIDALKTIRASIVSGQLPDAAIPMISVEKPPPPAPIINNLSGNTPSTAPSSGPVTAPAAAAAPTVLRSTPATPSTTYQTGPRGGCYKVTNNGNKSYVDRSLCR